jgi:hypothetical protein
MSYSRLIVEEVTDPDEISRFHAQHEQAQRKSAWLETHWDVLLPDAFGKFIAVAGGEAFIAESPREARDWAKTVHPEDKGALVEYVLPPGGPRFYANRR